MESRLVEHRFLKANQYGGLVSYIGDDVVGGYLHRHIRPNENDYRILPSSRFEPTPNQIIAADSVV